MIEEQPTLMLMTLRDTAKLLGVSESTVRNLVRDGEIKYFGVRSCIRFVRADVEEFIRRNSRGA
jgi:excisionase family DNA binding protein